MVSLIQLSNFGALAVVTILLWIVVPLPPGNRLYIFRKIFDVIGIGRYGARVAGVVIVAGILVPASLGVAPINRLPANVATALPGIIYIPFFISSVITIIIMLGNLRMKWILGRSAETDLQAPPTDGLSLVTGTVRAPDDHSSDDHLIHDYRDDMLIRVGIWEECDSLKRADPFVVEGPGGSIDVDPTHGHVVILEGDAEERRIGEGDEITVLGTVRVDRHGQFSMSGSEDFLYITPETPEEFRKRLLRSLILTLPLLIVSLLLTGWAVNVLVSFL